MGSNSAEHIPMCEQIEGSETTVEIKIKTLDSQTYTLRVDKQMPVPALKEQIASVTGVLSEQQRLICRGKVLKDDQLLSAYHVEDGHTLHLVVRQPVLPSSEGLPNHPGTDPASSTSRGQHQVAPGVVIETFSMPVQGDGFPPEISRIISAILGSIGLPNISGGSEGIEVREHGPQRPERTPGLSGMFDFSQFQSEQAGPRGPSDRSNGTFGHPTDFSLGTLPPLVLPDSLTTLSQYLSHLRREFEAIARDGGRGQTAATLRTEESSNASSHTGARQEGLPSPASLAEVMRSTRLLLLEQVGESLLQFASQLENQVNVTDPSARFSAQSSASRTGALFHNLGAFLLELGRTTMTLQLGQTPSDAVVNAGPAVFISPTGPNPIMVQPLPFQSGMSFGAIPMGAVQPGSGLVNGLGTGFVPRRIDIQIRRGSSATTPNVTREEHGDTQQPSGQRNPASSAGENPTSQATSRVSDGPAFAGDSTVRIVPLRTMVAAVPAPLSRLPSDSSGNSIGLYYPLLGRLQHVASGHVSGEGGTLASGDRPPAGLHADQQSSESAVEQQNVGGPAREGSTPNLRQEPSIARSVSVNILSAGGTQNNQESERQIPSGILQFIRNLFPGGEIHVEDGSAEGLTTGSVSDQARTSSGVVGAQEAEPRVTDEGLFFSNLLHQIMPFISQASGGEPGLVTTAVSNSSEHRMAQDSSTRAENSNVGTSRRRSDCEPNPPSSKRQKME
ncbi:PREDICTED: large proline-rich protein bag6-A isoform X1 [Prunus mume]|uniref:Large proline-rich protein bag6-A isoform X1 n=1 Tax=Prunus mume TaxID=102107 RepID=A0ABM0PQC5_PRUMU|nr:PREDICTED: large proline-rich protein bag6-A isoform X1 [Prunus mume]